MNEETVLPSFKLFKSIHKNIMFIKIITSQRKVMLVWYCVPKLLSQNLVCLKFITILNFFIIWLNNLGWFKQPLKQIVETASLLYIQNLHFGFKIIFATNVKRCRIYSHTSINVYRLNLLIPNMFCYVFMLQYLCYIIKQVLIVVS